MLAVLVALLLISILVASFYLQTRDSTSFATVSVAQKIASANADMGLQEGIRRVRGAQVPVGGISPCTQAEVDTNTCAGAFVGPMISGPANVDLANGGGLRYQFIVYLIDLGDPLAGGTSRRYVIRSTGFYGQNLNAPGLVTSIVEAEVQMNSGFSFNCVGSYECI